MKKTICMLLVLSLLLLQLPAFTVNADAAQSGITISVGSTEGENGEFVEVSLNVSADVEITQLGLANIEYDTEALTLCEFTNHGTIVEQSMVGADGLDVSSKSIVLAFGSLFGGLTPIVPNGKICDLKFQINDDAESGTYSITMLSEAANNETTVESTVNTGSITVRTHEHTYNKNWSMDEDNHWHEATCSHEDETADHGAHADKNKDGSCDICGYEMEEIHVCVYDQEAVKESALKTEADCENAAVYYKSCICGAVGSTETFTYGSAKGHTASSWKMDTNEHWKVCTVESCGDVIESSRGNHADNDKNSACDTCGYDMTIEHSCVFDQEMVKGEALKSEADCENAAVYYKSCECGAVGSRETFTYGSAKGHTESDWNNDENEHWTVCTECRDEIVNSRNSHADNDGDKLCDICDYEMISTEDPDDPDDLDDPDDPDDPEDPDDDDDEEIGGIWNNPFIDILMVGSSSKAIQYVYENGLFEGVSKNEFAPHMTMTRGMFVTVLGRLEGINEEVYGGSTFYDVQPGTWYAPGVAWASQNGIVQGYGNGSFGVNDEITVEQAVVILARYAKYLGIDTASDYQLTKFSDRNFVSPWAFAQMQWAVEQGIYDGNGRSLVPQKSASRELVAELIYHFANEYLN